ncbi:hypothetical protein ACIQ6K_28365 [Streptomyces sp. NPDC096354]|uniref:hypothetical protein n=1 Tax=Streptomyces sp. NPDC096354 TaxID=3366088 RepID=UPI00382C694F
MQKVRLYTSTAAALSLITGLLAWPVIGESSHLTAQVLISVLSGVAALTIVAPHAIGLSDRGDESIKLCSTYGAMYRELLEAKEQLATGSLKDPSRVADIICQFERIQERRDALALPAGDGHTDHAYALERIKEIGRRGWSVPGGLREIARPLLPSVRPRPQVSPTPSVDDEAVIAALIYVLKSGGAAQQMPPYSEVPTSTVHRPPLPVRPRTEVRGESSPGEVGRNSRPGSADPSPVVLDPTHVRPTETAKPHIGAPHSETGLPTL